MFAMFNLGPTEMLACGVILCFLCIPAVVLVVVLSIVLRRKRPVGPNDASNPLDRAKDAAAALTPAEREELRRSLEERHPQSPRGSEGIQ
jgi:hypothetical protein